MITPTALAVSLIVVALFCFAIGVLSRPRDDYLYFTPDWDEDDGD